MFNPSIVFIEIKKFYNYSQNQLLFIGQYASLLLYSIVCLKYQIV